MVRSSPKRFTGAWRPLRGTDWGHTMGKGDPMMIESMQGMGAAAGEKLGNGGLTNRPDADLTINRRIAGSPDRRIAGSPDR
ncbi:MAG: hypothetical protein OXH80_06550, partial [Nitrospira sp.]|nr:hypothetical protein [Nitrospira sp.]